MTAAILREKHSRPLTRTAIIRYRDSAIVDFAAKLLLRKTDNAPRSCDNGENNGPHME